MRNNMKGFIIGFIVATVVSAFAATITKPNTFTTGATIVASQFNDNFDTIYNDYNGNITNANIAAAAAVANSKLNLRTVTDSIRINETGTPLTLNNVTGTGPIFQVLDNGTTVFIVDDGGEVLIGTNAVDGLVHIVSGTGAGTISASADADEIVVENSGNSGLTILTPNTDEAAIYFGDADDNNIGQVQYDHSTDQLKFVTNNSGRMTIHSDGSVGIGISPADGTFHVFSADASTGTAGIADELTLEGTGNVGLSILTTNTGTGVIAFGDSDNSDVGLIQYVHTADSMTITMSGTERFIIGPQGFTHINSGGSANHDADLEVSDGATVGAGAIHRATSGTHSSRNRKSHIRNFNPAEKMKAYDDVKALDAVEFRYKVRNSSGVLVVNPAGKLRKGHILEDAPASIVDGETIIIDHRILNLELALQIVIDRVETLQADNNALKARVDVLETFHP